MATRQDLGLSVILLVSVPAAAVILGIVVGLMVPSFRLMQERIDQINRVLREQITGIRVCGPSSASGRSRDGSRPPTRS